MWRLMICAVGVSMLAACGDENSPGPNEDGNAQGNGIALSRLSREATSSECENGGVVLELGVDANGNAMLDDSEVQGTEVICDGTDGTENAISATLFCAGNLQGTSLFFAYNVAVTASGDVWVYGAIRDGFAEYGASTFYAGSQVGAQTAAVLFQLDLAGSANGGYWEISADRTADVVTIIATDTDLSGGSQTWTMAPENCVANTY